MICETWPPRSAAAGGCLTLTPDPVAIDAQLVDDPHLGPLVAKDPGRRVPRTVDAAEFALRAVLGQQVSTAAARTHAARVVARLGDPIDDHAGGLTHLFPDPVRIAGVGPDTLAVPRARARTLIELAGALAAAEIDLGPATDWETSRRRLSALPGFGSWTVETIAMRALGDPDAMPVSDLGVVKATRTLGLPSTPAALLAASKTVEAPGGPTRFSTCGPPANTRSIGSRHDHRHSTPRLRCAPTKLPPRPALTANKPPPRPDPSVYTPSPPAQSAR